MSMAEQAPISPFAQAYERLVANGYSPLPISPMSKAPSEFRGRKWRPMSNWQRFREAPASGFILKAWAMWPDCNVGILTGTRATATHIVACVDFDTDDAEMLIEMQRSLPPSPVMKRGKRGFSAFYLVPTGTDGFRTPIVELLTGTRQTVVPPSIHPDTGRPYDWTGSATLLDTPAASLPVLGEDELARFRDTVEALTDKPIAAPKAVVVPFPEDEDTVWRRLNARAFTDLDSWVPHLGIPKLRKVGNGYKGVAHWRASTTGRAIVDRNPNLSIVAHVGARDHGTGESYSAIDLAMNALDYDLDTAFQWLSDRLGLAEQPVEISEAPSPQPVEEPATAGPLPSHDPETGEVEEDPTAALSDELPDHLTRVPGLLGDIVDWICASNRKPNRVLALGSGLSVIGTLVGGGVAGPSSKNATHLYIACIAPSGAGKEYPKACCGLLLDACNAGVLNGPSDFKSHSAVVSELKSNPVMLCAVDELGVMLGRILSAKAKPHDSDISAILRELWGKNFMVYRTPAWAQARSEPIQNPGLSIYGSSTMDEMFSALTGKDVVNGFLNRWLLLPTRKRIMATEPKIETGEVPRELALSLAKLRTWAHKLSDDAKAAPIGDPASPRRRLRWGTRAEEVSKAMDTHLFHLCEDPELQIFYARTHEMAIRLATIRAAGNMTDVVQAVDMEWARDVAMWAAGFTAKLAGKNIAENDYQRNYNRVLNAIAERRTISMRDLRRRVKGLRELEWKDILAGLQAAELVRVVKKIPPAGGPPSMIYEYAGD
jgi:hypothetical protein